MTPIRYFLLLFLCAGLWLGISLPAAATAEPPGPETAGQPAMSIVQAAILGVVEGVTEYLPVSSTGHLLLAQRIMGIDGNSVGNGDQRSQDAVEAYTICIQAGAIIAVLGLYWRRVRQMWAGMAGRDPAGLRLLINIIVGFLPAAVIGLLFNGVIKAWLFGPWPVVAAWLAGGMAILAVHWYRQSQPQAARNGVSLDDLTWKMALIIGIAQCIAMWPGVSRSLITIVGGVLVGMSLPAAVEYSFLLGVLTLGGATAYDAVKHGQDMLSIFDPLSLTVGLVFAFLSAVAAIKWMVSYLNHHGMAVFGYYRVCLGLTVAALLATGSI